MVLWVLYFLVSKIIFLQKSTQLKILRNIFDDSKFSLKESNKL